MRSKSLALVVMTSLPWLTGAGSKSCSAEVDPGDASAKNWQFADVPEPSAKPLPMSCEWLDSQNCWKQAVLAALECAPQESLGALAPDRSSCSFDDGSELDFEGTISRLDQNEWHAPITNHRLLGRHGKPCYTAKILGVGKVAIDIGNRAYLFENLSLTTYRLTCPDGTSFQNDTEGTCDSFGLHWLAGKTPGADLLCAGDAGSCALTTRGGPAGKSTLARCRADG